MAVVDILSPILQYVGQYPVQIVISLIILHLIRNKFQPGLVNIPGPFTAAYTRLWKFHNVWKGQSHLDALKLHKKYGNLVRIGPNHVSVADPKWISVFYNMREEYLKTAFYPLQSITWKRKLAVNLFSTRDPEYHRAQRRKIGHTYSIPDLLQCESANDSCTELLLRRLDEVTSTSPSVDLGAWLQYYAYEVVSEISFTRKFGFLEQGKDIDDMIKAADFFIGYFSVIGQIPEYDRLLLGNPLLARIMAPMEAWNPILLFALNAIDEQSVANKNTQSTADSEKKDMTARWTSVEDSSPHKMDRRELVINLAANIFAGADTTSIALRSVFYHLCKHPQCMRRLVNDIDAAEKAGKLSTPYITYKDAIEIPYLTAVLKEAMRLHPSIAMLLERHVPPEGVEIDGHFLKGGTIVGINPWVTSRNADVFHPDPDDFRPERWLETASGPDSSVQHLKLMNDLWEFNFGGGVRKCLGRNISWIEMNKIVPELLRRYTIELTYPEKEWHVVNYWFTRQEGVICNLKRRR